MNTPVYIKDLTINTGLDGEQIIKDFFTMKCSDYWLIYVETMEDERRAIKDDSLNAGFLTFRTLDHVAHYLRNFGVTGFYVSVFGGVE